jgi:hypothetical protein
VPQEVEELGPLSVHCAFLVYSDVAQGRVAGRVEHVVSGQATRFTSLEELLAFMAQVLTTIRAPPPRRPRSR